MAGRRPPREQVVNSDVLELGDCPFVGNVSGIQSGFRFDEHDMNFLVRDGAVLHTARDDDEFTFAHDGFMVRNFIRKVPLTTRNSSSSFS